jgi:16S rRNA (adenine1518-N6/adenine1519-N6)-dimethyltransferase
VGYYAEVRRFFKISRNCFFPKPKVDSCLVGIDILRKPKVSVKDPEAMFRVIKKAFSQRRKKILNPLSADCFMGLDKNAWAKVLFSAGVDVSLRAEDISLKEYAGISDEAVKVSGRC